LRTAGLVREKVNWDGFQQCGDKDGADRFVVGDSLYPGLGLGWQGLRERKYLQSFSSVLFKGN
jgi:hypothetical protein